MYLEAHRVQLRAMLVIGMASSALSSVLRQLVQIDT